MNAPIASILIPTHNHCLTLPLAVKSALQQTVQNLEVIIIGDGVDAATRSAAQALQAEDARVLFLDLPKERSHGEVYRDLAIQQARSDAIFYLCDDDLLLPNHVANLLQALEEVVFAHALSCYFDVHGELVVYPTDLAKPAAIAWHLLEPRRNSVSITGACHRKDYYLALPEGWSTTPANEWPDHYMWKKFFRCPDIRAKTVMEITAIQFPSSLDGRDTWTQAQRLAEITHWFAKLPDAQTRVELQQLTGLAALRQLDEKHRQLDLVVAYNEQLLAVAQQQLSNLQQEHAEVLQQLKDSATAQQTLAEQLNQLQQTHQAALNTSADYEQQIIQLQQTNSALSHKIDQLYRSYSWRLMTPLRVGSRPLRRLYYRWRQLT